MNCPKCGEPINENQNFCSNCGLSLDDKAALFDQCKRATKKAFLADCLELVPEKHGAKILGKAAWFIVTNAPHRFDYLQGNLRGSPESFMILSKMQKSATVCLNILQTIRTLYGERKEFVIISSDNFDKIVQFRPADY